MATQELSPEILALVNPLADVIKGIFDQLPEGTNVEAFEEALIAKLAENNSKDKQTWIDLTDNSLDLAVAITTASKNEKALLIVTDVAKLVKDGLDRNFGAAVIDAIKMYHDAKGLAKKK